MFKKAFDKIQQLVMVRTFSKLGIERKFFSLIKASCEKPVANIKSTLSSEDWEQGKDTHFHHFCMYWM